MSKYCDICGDKCGIFTREKLENGLICGKCRSKLSYWFLRSETLSKYTIADIKAQLCYRENNKNLIYLFHSTQQIQINNQILLKVDDGAEKFMIVNQREDSNPDVLDLSKYIDCVVDSEEKIEKHKEESGRVYYDTTCKFYIVIRVNTPYYTQINVENKSLSLRTYSDPDDPFYIPSYEESKEYNKYETDKLEAKNVANTIAEAINRIFRDYHEKQEEVARIQRKSAMNEKIKEIIAQVTNKFDESKLLQVSALSAKDKVKEYGRLREFCISYIPELKNNQAKLASVFNKEFQKYVDTAMCQCFDSGWAALSKAFFTLSRGIQGENNVEEVLSLYDDRIYFIRDFTWIYEHDFIVLAPSGIYTIEVKMLSDDYVLTETGMLKPLNDHNKMIINVVLQSRKHIETLRKGLKECAAYTSDIPIAEIICCADGKYTIKNEFPDIDVCYCNTLNKYILPNDVENKLTAERMAELKDFLLKNGEKKPHTYAVFGAQGDLPDKDEFVRNFAYTVGAKYVQENFHSF